MSKISAKGSKNPQKVAEVQLCAVGSDRVGEIPGNLYGNRVLERPRLSQIHHIC
jgi:hypothetical protein